MRISRIKINNFKSFGNQHNHILMSSDVMAIIGKNGSGKTNVLEALRGLQFFAEESHKTLSASNYYQRDGKVSIVFDIDITSDDYLELTSTLGELSPKQENLRFDFFKFNDWGYFMSFQNITEDGCWTEDSIFSKILPSDTKSVDIFSKLLTVAKSDKARYSGNDKNIHDSLVYWAEHWFALHSFFDYDWIKNHYRNSIKDTDIDYIREYYNKAMEAFSRIMPHIFIYDDSDSLNDCYKKEDLVRENRKFFKSPSALRNLICALNCNVDTFLQTLESQLLNPTKTAIRDIKLKINKFNEDFNNFYNNRQEKIELSLNFSDQQCCCDIARMDDPVTFKMSERSNGLRWYLAFFAGLRSTQNTSHALILIDEPAVHLHVDAQKEVLKLFDNLAEKGYQVIYTTHNQSMLDINQWERIRAMEKTNNISYIFPLYVSRANISNLETLSPIQQAMGCCLKNTLAPCPDRCNLITEGITDYYYLKAMGTICGIPEDKIPYIIPACSADNVPNICSVLVGWGYPVKILLDNDSEGKKVMNRLQKGFPENFNNGVFFVSENEGDDIEKLISEDDFNKFKIVNAKGKLAKTTTALGFMTAVLSRKHIVSDETLENFKNLFCKLDFLKKEDKHA